MLRAGSDIPYLDRRSLSPPAARTARSRSPRRRNPYPGRTSGRKPAGRARRRWGIRDTGAHLRTAPPAGGHGARLSRTDKDRCRLLEVCQIFGTLIADEQQVYDLNYLDDQLVLGIKGTLSVVELKVLRQRLQAGQESKARRGELFKRLPVGYVRDPMGKVVFHPDQRVCEAIQLVFVKFRERWSVRQTFQWFRDHDVELPVNPIQGTQLVWKIPTQSLVRDILCNPFYAGAYVWGRRPVETLLIEGRLEKRQSATRRAEDCRVFIRDHHVGYIDWAIYEENQRMTRRNSVNWQGDETMAAIRAGQGLLVGLLRCGHCGRKLHVRYWGGSGTHARYLCRGDYDDGGQYCLGFGGAARFVGFHKDLMSKSKETAQKALQLDDGLADAHGALGWVRWAYDWDWPGAENEFRRAIQLNPSHAMCHGIYARYLDSMGRFEEAIREHRIARELDPLALILIH